MSLWKGHKATSKKKKKKSLVLTQNLRTHVLKHYSLLKKKSSSKQAELDLITKNKWEADLPKMSS